MLENALFQLIISTVNAGLAANGFPNVKLKQDFQPAQDGTNTQPTAYIHLIGDHRFGSPKKTNSYDSVSGAFINTMTEFYESKFQISTLALVDPRNPASVAAPTARDIANMITAILQSDSTLRTFSAQGVRIYRIEDIRKPNFIDDKNRFEASPNFDFTVTHEQDIISSVPKVSKIDSGIFPI